MTTPASTNAPLDVLTELQAPGAVVDPAVLSWLWSRLDRPEDAAPAAWWVAAFRAAGFTVDGRPAPRPTSPLRLYRGADWWRSDGMAWTTSRAVARRFATQDEQRGAGGRLWTTVAPPAALLARIGGERQEDEVVVDPALLGTVEADDERPARVVSRSVLGQPLAPSFFGWH